MAQSIIRQNYHAESEALLNKQINMELYASYVYLSMVIIPGYKESILSFVELVDCRFLWFYCLIV